MVIFVLFQLVKVVYEFRYRATFTGKKDLLKSWLNRISPTVSRYLSLDSIVADVVSSLLYILSPPALRPVRN
jgi:hypothetical protein